MAQPPTTGTQAPVSLPLYCVALAGKLVGKPRTYTDRDGRKMYAHLVRLPAPDEWSSASTVEVQARENLGADGDAVRLIARVSGTARPFVYTDKDSGEKRQGQDVTIRLTVVE